MAGRNLAPRRSDIKQEIVNLLDKKRERAAEHAGSGNPSGSCREEERVAILYESEQAPWIFRPGAH